MWVSFLPLLTLTALDSPNYAAAFVCLKASAKCLATDRDLGIFIRCSDSMSSIRGSHLTVEIDNSDYPIIA